MNKDMDFWEYIKGYDVIGLVETWVEDGQWKKIEHKLPTNYNWKHEHATRKHKKGRAMGGILTGVKKNLECPENDTINTKYMQERKVKIDGDVWRISTIYSKGNMEEVENIIKTERGNWEDRFLVMGGDFKARTEEFGGIIDMNGEEMKRCSKDKEINKEGERLLRMIEENGWNMLNGNMYGDEEGEYTYLGARGESVIDYIVTNQEAYRMTHKFKVETRTESDHQPIRMEIDKEKQEDGDEEEEKSVPVWKEEDIIKYRQGTKNIRFKKETVDDRLEELIFGIKKAIIVKKFHQKKENFKNNWWGKECKAKKKELRRDLKDCKSGKLTKKKYNKRKKSYRKFCEQRRKTKKTEEEEEIRNIKNENDIWKYIRRDRKEERKTSKKIKMDAWVAHFCTQLEGEYKRQVEKQQTREERVEDITESEVRKQVDRLKKGKAAGEDSLQNEVWINSTDNVIQKLTEIINMVWQGKGFPSRWRKGVIAPIHKKGDRHEAKNYRGVTLLDTSYKIYAMVLQERLAKEAEELNLLPDTQAGFRKERSAMDNIYILNHAIEEELKKERGKMYVIFADLKSAFDRVNRRKLIEVLSKAGISGRLTNKIAEIYEETKNTVRAHGEESEEFWTKKGVRQGCPLSPLLFALYIADIEEYMARGQTGGTVIGKKKFWTLAYADDLAGVAKTEGEMKSMIKRLASYLEKKELELNAEKTKIMKFKKGGGRENKVIWKWKDEEELEEVKCFKYLGYTFQRNNRSNKHIQDLTKRAAVAMAQIWGIGQRKFQDNIRMRILLFDYTVRSILLYGAEIWGWTQEEKVEATQTKYLKWILGLDTTTPTYIVQEETKRSKIKLEAGKRAMKYEIKIRLSHENQILHECWKEINKKKEKKNKNRWEIERNNYYERNGYSTEEIEIRRMSGNTMVEEIITRDSDIETQQRRKKIDNSRYNTNYKNIITLTIPRYLLNDTGKKGVIKCIARFRCGNEERKNFHWKSEEERQCRLCGRQEETIDHLLRECRETKRENITKEEILEDSGKGARWMKTILEKRQGT